MSTGALHAYETGEGVALLALHGFTGSGETWRPFAARWPGVRVIAPDLPGHGRSLGLPAGIGPTIELLLALADARGIERFAVLGYSMGGRIALRLALAAPQRVRALIVESASPGIEDAAGRRARVAADERLAQRIEREGVEAFVDYWQSLPLWRSQAGLPAVVREALRAQRLGNDARGLAASLRAAGAGVDLPLGDRLGGLSCPVRCVAGMLDDRYCDHARAIAAAVADGRAEIVPQAGHAVHLEQPDRFATIVQEAVRPAG